jgi:hypothetical protein
MLTLGLLCGSHIMLMLGIRELLPQGRQPFLQPLRLVDLAVVPRLLGIAL